MGRTDYRVRAQGMTEADALRNAVEADRAENGHGDGYTGTIGSRTTYNAKCVKQPKPAKKCTVEKKPKVKIKWKKAFVVQPAFGDPSQWGYQQVDDTPETKGEAIKRAKEMALKFGKAYKIKIDMQPDKADTTLAVVTPLKSEQGVWEFWGEARD